jgi:CRISPR system Cascade subunit CasD
VRYLRATLAAPLASFGGAAASGTRKDGGGPQRSAVIGLVCACLGVDRAANAEMRQLSSRLGVLVRMDRPGDLLVDYHTSQSPGDAARKAWAKDFGAAIPTRRTLLTHARAVDDLGTSLSTREYRTDVVLTLLLWDRRGDEAAAFLDGLAEAMRRPVFTPTLGRRACPLSLPMCPEIIEAPGVLEALWAGQEKPSFHGEGSSRPKIDLGTRAGHVEMAIATGRIVKTGKVTDLATGTKVDVAVQPAMCHADMDALVAAHVEERVLSYRRDEPRDRAAWLFSERREMAFPMPEQE